MYLTNVRLSAIAVILAVMIHSNLIAAQVAGPPSAALLVLSPTPLTNGHVSVRRHTVAQPYDLVIVDSGASERDVASAIGLLGVLRGRAGVPAQGGSRGAVTGVAPSSASKAASDQVSNAKRLHDLPHATSRSIQGLGKVHAIPIDIP